MSKIKRFHKNKQNKKFFKYMFLDYGKITGAFIEQPPFITPREKLKIDKTVE